MPILVFSQGPYQGEIPSEKIKQENLAALNGKCRIILVRHGETKWNAQGAAQGWTDIPLNDEGKDQARVLSDKLSEIPIQCVYSSSLSRATETAQIIANPHKASVIPDPTLRFYNRNKKWLNIFRSKKSKKEHMVKEIMTDSVAYLKKLAHDHPEETLVVVTHARVIKYILVALGENNHKDIAIRNGAFITVLGSEDSLVLERSQ